MQTFGRDQVSQRSRESYLSATALAGLVSHVFPAEPSIKIGSQALIHVPPVGDC